MTHKIGWLNRPGTTGETWNPVTGCTKISEGCKNCYAERMSKRLKGRFGYPADGFSVALHEDKLDKPLGWKKPRTVFVCSMGDLFHKDVPFWYIARIVDVMESTPEHTYLLLTKRPDRMLEFTEWMIREGDDMPLSFTKWAPNVWLGVTAENQKRLDERAPLLLQCPAAKRFVSYEPALGKMDAAPYLPCGTCGNSGIIGHSCDSSEDCPDCPGHSYYQGLEGSFLDWVICGGETGPGARAMDPDWARGVRDQCKAAGVPFFFKQMSNKETIPADLLVREWPGGAE